jgi:hypothetical protein
MSNDNIERTLGQILANQENTNGWLRSIDKKLDGHVEKPHADPDEVKANTRWRWMLSGVVALVTAIGSVLAYLR